MTTPTYTYRLYTYKNGLNETVYRAKHQGFLWFWTWLHYPMQEDTPIEWRTREGALTCIRRHAKREREKLAAADHADKQADLKPVIIEDVEA